MKYSLAFLFVAVTAILVTSVSRSINAAPDNIEEFDASTLSQLASNSPKINPAQRNDLLAERERNIKELNRLLAKLARKAQPNVMRRLQVAFTGQKSNVDELNQILVQLARNAAQRAQLVRVELDRNVNELTQKANERIARERLTRERTAQPQLVMPQLVIAQSAMANLASDQWERDQKERARSAIKRILDELDRNTAERAKWANDELALIRIKLSDNELDAIKKALQIFVSPNKALFEKILKTQGVPNLSSERYRDDGLDYKIAEAIWNAPYELLENALDAIQAALLQPTKISN